MKRQRGDSEKETRNKHGQGFAPGNKIGHRWPKGVSGNPKGRPPKVRCIPDILDKIGAETVPESLIPKVRELFPTLASATMTLHEAVLRMTYVRALQGEAWAVQFIADRTEGRALERAAVAHAHLHRDDNQGEFMLELECLTDDELEHLHDLMEKAQLRYEEATAASGEAIDV